MQFLYVLLTVFLFSVGLSASGLPMLPGGFNLMHTKDSGSGEHHDEEQHESEEDEDHEDSEEHEENEEHEGDEEHE
jgi:hypothetical protein